MQFVEQIVQGTPVFVWFMLAYLVFVGVRQTRPKVVAIARIYILPCAFVVLGLAGLLARGHASPATIGAWLAGIAVFSPAGWLGAPRLLAVDRAHRLVRRPGSWLPLIRMLVAFIAQYVIAVAVAVHPDHAGDLAIAAAAISGASAGYFGGWGAAMWYRMRSAPEASLRDPAAASASA